MPIYQTLITIVNICTGLIVLREADNYAQE